MVLYIPCSIIFFGLEELGSLGTALAEPPGVLVAVAQVAGNLTNRQIIDLLLLRDLRDGHLAFLEETPLLSGQGDVFGGERRQGGYVGQLGGVHVS